MYHVLLNKFWGLPRDPENTFKLSNNKLPLSATVSKGRLYKFFKFWNQSFDFNEADVYLVLIINPFINRKKG